MEIEKKKWYQSWTVWVNVAILTIDFINALAQFIPIPAGVLTGLGAVANIILRFKSDKPII